MHVGNGRKRPTFTAHGLRGKSNVNSARGSRRMSGSVSLVGRERTRAEHHNDDSAAFTWGVNELRKLKSENEADIIKDQLDQWDVFASGPH